MSAGEKITLSAGGEWRCWRHPIGEEASWCHHLRDWFSTGEDAEHLHPGMHLVVPVIPTEGIYTQVSIADGADEFSGSCMLKLQHTNDFGKIKEVHLGFWNPGEGLLVIREVILDYIRANVDPREQFTGTSSLFTKCPNSAHSLKGSRIISENQHKASWRCACLWNIVMEGACTPCVNGDREAVTGNFGVDSSVASSGRPWAGGGAGGSASAVSVGTGGGTGGISFHTVHGGGGSGGRRA